MRMDGFACRLDVCYVHQSVFEQRFLKSLVLEIIGKKIRCAYLKSYQESWETRLLFKSFITQTCSCFLVGVCLWS